MSRVSYGLHHGYTDEDSSFEESWKDRIPGGRASGRVPEDFNPRELHLGVRNEMEHTTDVRVATEIAMDHLSEDPAYYTKAATHGAWGKMNKGAEKGLKKYGEEKTVAEITKDLEGKAKDPQALAASIRRKALGTKEFSLHQKWGKTKDPEEKAKLKAKMKVKG
jgi:hypothetical protein